MFHFNDGADVIEDFTDDIDTIALDVSNLGLTGQSIQQVLAMASVVGGDTVFDFGDGNTLTLLGVTDIAALADDILIL